MQLEISRCLIRKIKIDLGCSSDCVIRNQDHVPLPAEQAIALFHPTRVQAVLIEPPIAVTFGEHTASSTVVKIAPVCRIGDIAYALVAGLGLHLVAQLRGVVIKIGSNLRLRTILVSNTELFVIGYAGKKVPTSTGKRGAEICVQRELFTTAFRGLTTASIKTETLFVLLSNEVHNASNSVGTVGSRRAASYNFDSVDKSARDCVQADVVATVAV